MTDWTVKAGPGLGRVYVLVGRVTSPVTAGTTGPAQPGRPHRLPGALAGALLHVHVTGPAGGRSSGRVRAAGRDGAGDAGPAASPRRLGSGRGLRTAAGIAGPKPGRAGPGRAGVRAQTDAA